MTDLAPISARHRAYPILNERDEVITICFRCMSLFGGKPTWPCPAALVEAEEQQGAGSKSMGHPGGRG